MWIRHLPRHHPTGRRERNEVRIKKRPYILPGSEGHDKALLAKEAVEFAESDSTEGLKGLIELCDEIKRQASLKLGIDTQIQIAPEGQDFPPLEREEDGLTLGGLNPSPALRKSTAETKGGQREPKPLTPTKTVRENL